MEHSDHSPPASKAARQASPAAASSSSSASSTTTAENSLLFSPFPAVSSSSSSSSGSSSSATPVPSLSSSEFSLEQEEMLLRSCRSSTGSASCSDAVRATSKPQDEFYQNFKEATSIVFGAPGSCVGRMVNFKTMLKLYATAPVFREAFDHSVPMGDVEIGHLSKLQDVVASPLYKGFPDGGRAHIKSPLSVRLCLDSVQLHPAATSREWDSLLRGLILLPGNPGVTGSDRRRQLFTPADPRVAAAFRSNTNPLNTRPTSFVKHVRLARCDFRQAGAKVLNTLVEVIDASAGFNSLAIHGNNLFFGGAECFHTNQGLESPCALARLKPDSHTCVPSTGSAELFLCQGRPITGSERARAMENEINSDCPHEEQDMESSCSSPGRDDGVFVETESTDGSVGGCVASAESCKPIAFRTLFANPAVQARLQHLEFARFCPPYLVQNSFYGNVPQGDEAAAQVAGGGSPGLWGPQKEWQAVHHARLQQIQVLNFFRIELPKLAELRTLDLSRNFNQSSWMGVSSNEKLESACLAIRKLTKLEVLRATHNQMTGEAVTIVMEALLSLPKLHTLDLSHNCLNAEDVGSIWNKLPQLESLSNLDLSHNFLGSSLPDYCRPSDEARLLLLSLAGNDLGDDAWKMMRHIRALQVQTLNLSGINLGNAGVQMLAAHMRGFDSLRKLDLSRNQFDHGCLPEAMDIMPTITLDQPWTLSVETSNVRLQDARTEHIQAVKASGAVPVTSPFGIADLPQLQEINIQQNAFSESMVRKLKRYLLLHPKAVKFLTD